MNSFAEIDCFQQLTQHAAHSSSLDKNYSAELLAVSFMKLSDEIAQMIEFVRNCMPSSVLVSNAQKFLQFFLFFQRLLFKPLVFDVSISGLKTHVRSQSQGVQKCLFAFFVSNWFKQSLNLRSELRIVVVKHLLFGSRDIFSQICQRDIINVSR